MAVLGLKLSRTLTDNF